MALKLYHQIQGTRKDSKNYRNHLEPKINFLTNKFYYCQRKTDSFNTLKSLAFNNGVDKKYKSIPRTKTIEVYKHYMKPYHNKTNTNKLEII